MQLLRSIIAVHGLGGHAYGSFKERGGSYMWLEDSLLPSLMASGEPSTRCSARILTYGYDAHIENSDCFQSIRDLASQLRALLRTIRRVSRPEAAIGQDMGH
jgi:protein SERAC1